MPIVWEALENDGTGVVSDWNLPVKVAAKLEQKLDMLRSAEIDAAGRPVLPHGMFAGPVHGQKSIYKVLVNGELALRPMIGKSADGEWIVLARCVKKGNDTGAEEIAAVTAGSRLAEIATGARARKELT